MLSVTLHSKWQQGAHVSAGTFQYVSTKEKNMTISFVVKNFPRHIQIYRIDLNKKNKKKTILEQMLRNVKKNTHYN